MTVYGGTGGGPRKPKKRRSRTRRIIYWTVGSVFTLVLAVAAAVGWWLYNDLQHLTNSTPAEKKVIPILGHNDPTLSVAQQPAIALIIGSDHRYADGSGAPSRSDTLILVRVDPKTGLMSLLSLPRDLYVDIPGYGSDKINAAYSDGGPLLAVKTVESVTGVKPQYLVTVNFHGFTNLVNDIGGVYVPVDQNYQHSNAGLPTSETYSAISVAPGYQLLSGQNALSFSRYRHNDSDFYRNARQQTFLRQFQQAMVNRFHGFHLSDLNAIHNVLDDISNNVDITGNNINLSTIQDYAGLISKIHGHIVSARLSGETTADINGASVVTDSPSDIHRAVYEFLHPQLVHQPGSQLPHPKPKRHAFKPGIEPSKVKVATLNGTRRSGLASKAAAGLAGWGYHAKGSNAPTTGYQRTWVYYRPGFARAAADIVNILGHGYALPVPPKFTQTANIVLILGADYPGLLKLHPPVTKPVKLPTDMIATQSYRTDFRAAAHAAHLPGLYPTAVNSASQLQAFSATQPIRHYTINAAGKGQNSVYAYWYFNQTPGAYWGIEETRFVQAPILYNPSAVRHLDGRSYSFYFNGAHIHIVAIIDNVHHVAYWVQNTLLDGLSNADMIAIARSLKPTG